MTTSWFTIDRAAASRDVDERVYRESCGNSRERRNEKDAGGVYN